ncbi:MAG: MAPEG family protein [Reyranella sp.]|nr:MAPEG family protein [Reyranella sp.]
MLLLGASFLILPRLFNLPVDMLDRLAFVLRVDVFVLVWILIGVRMVSRVRFYSAADMGGSAAGPPSAQLAIKAAFLQNTLEQAVMAVGVHLALATLLSGPALSLIVGAAVLFSIGRVAFYLGYSSGAGGRAFGMVVTVLPTLAGFLLAIVLIIAAIFGYAPVWPTGDTKVVTIC